MAGICIGDRVKRRKGEADTGAVECNCGAYPAIPKITADGIYGSKTAESVRKFQEVFQLPQTGKVDYSTWYKISEIYVGVSRIAELT